MQTEKMEKNGGNKTRLCWDMDVRGWMIDSTFATNA